MNQQVDVLDACWQKLPVDLREAIIRRFYPVFSFEEIAAITGKSQRRQNGYLPRIGKIKRIDE